VSPAQHDGPVIGARHHPLEAEADRIADRIAAAPADGSRGTTIPVQRVSVNADSRGDRAPASVERALDGPGRSLDPALREDMEQRFGHPLTRVRLHADAAAAKSAADVDARAYTVGDDVVFGAGQFAPATAEGRRLIAHEVAHVLQQSGSHGYLQRAGPAMAELSTTEGQLAPGPAQPPASAGMGLDQPDCSTRVADVFWLGPTYVDGARPECGFAEIHLLEEMSSYGVVRADYPLPQIPCEEGNTKSHGTWLRYGSHEWRVLEIRNDGVDVMNACGDEDTLGLAGSPPPKPAPGPPPEHSVKVADGKLGSGTVLTFDGCARIEFIPDGPGETRSWVREVWKDPRGQGDFAIYVPERGEKVPYAPNDLSGMVRVQLVGDKCGQPLPPPEVEPEPVPGMITE
jgi:hypothetical protein